MRVRNRFVARPVCQIRSLSLEAGRSKFHANFRPPSLRWIPEARWVAARTKTAPRCSYFWLAERLKLELGNRQAVA